MRSWYAGAAHRLFACAFLQCHCGVRQDIFMSDSAWTAHAQVKRLLYLLRQTRSIYLNHILKALLTMSDPPSWWCHLSQPNFDLQHLVRTLFHLSGVILCSSLYHFSFYWIWKNCLIISKDGLICGALVNFHLSSASTSASPSCTITIDWANFCVFLSWSVARTNFLLEINFCSSTLPVSR